MSEAAVKEDGGRLFGYRAETLTVQGATLAAFVADAWMRGTVDMDRAAWDVVPVRDFRPHRLPDEVGGGEIRLDTYAAQITLRAERRAGELQHEARHLGAVAARTVLAAARQAQDAEHLDRVPEGAAVPEARAPRVGESPHVMLGVLDVKGAPWNRLNLRIEEQPSQGRRAPLGPEPGALQVLIDFGFAVVWTPKEDHRR